MLDGLHQSRHVWTTVIRVDVLVAGESKLTQSERTIDRCLHKRRLDAAPADRQCTNGTDTHGTNPTNKFNHHASERSSRDRRTGAQPQPTADSSASRRFG